MRCGIVIDTTINANVFRIEGKALSGTLSNAYRITDKQTDVSDMIV